MPGWKPINPWRRGGRGWGNTVLLRDTFTDTDGVTLAAHTMDVGGGWTMHVGTWTVASNKARADGTGGSVATADAGQANVVVTADVTVDLTSSALNGLVARYTDANNHWIAGVDTGGQLYVYEMAGGSLVLRASAAHGMTDGQTYAFTMTCSGTTIAANANGATASYGSASSGLSATRCGPRAGSSTTFRADNFEVTTA